jgi:hypothetical protein
MTTKYSLALFQDEIFAFSLYTVRVDSFDCTAKLLANLNTMLRAAVCVSSDDAAPD